MRDLLIVSLVGAGTLAMRAVFIVSALSVPVVLERWMRHAKPAILAALVGGFLAGGGNVSIPGVAALLVAGAVAWRKGGMVAMIVGGVATAALLQV